MPNDFVCTGQLVEELTRLREAYKLLEDGYTDCRPLPQHTFQALTDFFERRKNVD